MNDLKIKYYDDFLSPKLKAHLLKEGQNYPGVKHLVHLGQTGGLETKESLSFLCELYETVFPELDLVLKRRARDRKFIDERTKSCVSFNQELKKDFLNPDYQTILGMEDAEGRIVFGPKLEKYYLSNGKPISAIPEFLQGHHVTLFGPPDNAKLSINAMNAYHRKLKDEPAIVSELLSTQESLPKWGADDEDSKTPTREDLISAGVNLTKCLDGTLELIEAKKYELEKENRSLPIKRFPGLALPCFFLFYKDQPIPLHLYDFALHFFKNWHNKKALAFYVPKLENEEEARYIRIMLETAERMIKKIHPEYEIGTIRLMIVLENPRAVFRTNEIMDELYPYFVGASLGWHDYLASTARLFKEDANYRIPVKADPDIVIKYIKASHDLLANVVGPRGGVKVGGMYGILPLNNELMGDSFQVTIKGYIRDVITQLKRDLTGFWVAHPDFVRLGLALVEAWNVHKKGDSTKLDLLVKSLLAEKYHNEILNFIHGQDIQGLNPTDPMYARSLVVADMKESNFIANHHPDEIRYNVFQSLQYITDWLSGNGCVALPAHVGGVAVRVMDDLATAERSRWEVWHEIYHGRFSVEDFLQIAHEELNFIRKDLSNSEKIVQVKWDNRTEKWYPVAFNLMLKLMTDKNPVEFATQLFLPFTIQDIRDAADPWKKALELDAEKFFIREDVKRFSYYFEMCGSKKFASQMIKFLAQDLDAVHDVILKFDQKDIIEAAAFHGDIGEGKKTLDKMAQGEQARVFDVDEKIKSELKELGTLYKAKFGMKFLVSAQGKSGEELLLILKDRFTNTLDVEINNARDALWQITQKRMRLHPLNHLKNEIHRLFEKHRIHDAQVALIDNGYIQQLNFGNAHEKTWFEMASLSKSVGSAFAIEYFRAKGISLSTSVNKLLSQTKSKFRLLDGDEVQITHLMSHSALNMHYVNGVPADQKMPKIDEFMSGNATYGYVPIQVINRPGSVFQYSGGGFIVLEYLIEQLEEKSIFDLTEPFLKKLGMNEFSFRQENLPGVTYAHGFKDDGSEIEGTRKMFPAFAAGSMGNAKAMAQFLVMLEEAFHSQNGCGGISHDTARIMLHGTDKGCKAFMGANMGLGVFIGEAGPNKLAIHQGANDGFRCIYLHCYSGPDRGKGLVVLCNEDFRGVLFNAEVTQEILRVFAIDGVDTSKFKTQFTSDSIPQEEVVNIGYKNLVFNAFSPNLPEAIIEKGPLDHLSSFNKLHEAKIISVSNELFARAENLISNHLSKFDPELFGKQGKIMDSWETVRHNLSGVDSLVLEMKEESSLRYVFISTKYHFGNHAPYIKIEGEELGQWHEILSKTALNGHSELRIKLKAQTKAFKRIKVSIYPDGGLTRLALYENLPTDESIRYLVEGAAKSEVCPEKIPQTIKPLSINYRPTSFDIKKNLSQINPGEEFNNASLAFGAKILRATDEHYSPAFLMLSPFAPINMFDGLESARSRVPDHFEEVIVALAVAARVHRIEMDFTYFVNNNPLEVSVEGKANNKWISLIEKENVKAFAGNKKFFEIVSTELLSEIKVKTFPDGGMNRLKVYSRL